MTAGEGSRFLDYRVILERQLPVRCGHSLRGAWTAPMCSKGDARVVRTRAYFDPQRGVLLQTHNDHAPIVDLRKASSLSQFPLGSACQDRRCPSRIQACQIDGRIRGTTAERPRQRFGLASRCAHAGADGSRNGTVIRARRVVEDKAVQSARRHDGNRRSIGSRVAVEKIIRHGSEHYDIFLTCLVKGWRHR